MTTSRSLRRKQRTHKSASMVATSLLATSALLGTYLGNPRLGKAYASTPCTAGNAAAFNIHINDTNCDIIDITANFTATDAVRAIADGDLRTSLTINGVGEGITITGGGSLSNFRLLDNQKSGLSLTISNLTIQNFKFAGNGGAIFSKGNVTVTNSTFSGNVATGGSGGGFRSGEDADATVTNSTFSDNTAVSGGGFRSGEENATVTNSTFSGNEATGGSGGGFRSEENATVTNSTFSGNIARADAGGVSHSYSGGGFRSGANATVTNSTFSGNTAANDGGGFRSGEDATVTNSTFSVNIAGGDGEAIFSRDGGVVTYSIFNTNDTFSYYNENEGVIKNLPLPGRTGVIVGDPLLGALQNNGGSTLTMLPGAGSPAIDSGSNAAAAGLVDQRGTGFPRIFNATVDMGAVEVQGSDAISEDDASSDEGSWDGIGVNSLTTVLLKDQSGLDSDWSDTDIFLGALNAVLKEKPESKLKVLADGSVKLTAFLPTDRAFRKLAFDLTGIRPRNDKATMRVIESLDLETIEKVLLYHVVLGDPIGSSDALKANGVTLTTLSGETFSVRVTKRPNIFLRDINKNLRNPNVLLKRVDINSGNRQVAHVINRVLIPVEDIK